MNFFDFFDLTLEKKFKFEYIWSLPIAMKKNKEKMK